MPKTKPKASKAAKTKQIKKPVIKAKAEQEAEQTPPKSSKILIIAFCVLTLAGLGSSWFFYNRSRLAEQQLKAQKAEKPSEETELIEKVGRHVLLPEDEKPTIATVKDKSKLADQPFFNNAKQDDKVLAYPKSRRVILYRPSVDKIIEMSTLSTEPQQSVPAPSAP